MPVMVAEGRSGTSMGAVIVPLPETTVPSNQGAEVTGVVLKAPVDEFQMLNVPRLEKLDAVSNEGALMPVLLELVPESKPIVPLP